MGSSGSASDATLQKAETVFTGLETPCTPLSTEEVAAELDCEASAASETLATLADRDDLRGRDVDDETRVWWRPAAATESADGRGDAQSEEAEYRAFVEAVRDYAIFVLDPDGTVASWNQGAERIKGYDREDVVGEHFSTFYTEADVAEGVPEANLQRAVEEGRVEDEGWRVRADGTEFWANVTITAIRDGDGDLRGFTKVTRDMTERREYELQLRHESDQTEQLLRTAPVAIAVHDADGETILANRQAREALGLREGELDTDPIEQDSWTVCDGDGDELTSGETPSARVLASGEPVFDEEIVVEPPAREPIRFRVNAAPVTDGDGEVDRVVTVAEDVTELRRRQRRLERRKSELETELSEVLGRISDAFYAVDDEWRFTHLNDRAVEILGRDREALLGRELWDVFDDADDVYREHFETAMATQEPESFEVYEDQIDAWLEFTVYPSESGLSIYFRDVTERKGRERELERYETLFTESTDVNAVLNPDGTFQYLPPSVENVLGYDQDELLGENTFELVHPEDRERIAGEFEQLVADPDYRPRNEFRFRHADGHWVWLESVGRNLLDDPSIEGIVAYTRDVTGRVERERELRRKERRFQAVFEDPNILVGLLDPDGTVLDINGTAMEYVDADLAAVRGEPFWETPWWGTSDGVQDDVRDWVERAAAGEYVDFEADLARPDGEAYTLEGVFRPVTDEDGDVVSVIVSDRDVTERREREQQLSRLMDNVPGMVYHCRNERGWPMSFVSDACEDVTGYDPGAVERDEVNWGEDVIVEADREMVWEEIQDAFAASDTFSITYRIETADGDVRWVRDYGRGVFENGEAVGIEGIIADITERKRLEDELQESERRYRTLAEYFPNGIVTLFDDDLTYELAAGRGFSDIPVSAAGLEGSHVDEAWDEETAEVVRPLFEDALDGEEQSIELEYVGRHWVVRAVPITDDAGEVVAGMTMAQDVTGRVERERELATYETIVETVDDGIYVKDDDGFFTMVNESYADLTGYDEDELVGEHASLVVNEDAIEESAEMETVSDDGPTRAMEAPVQRADGGTVPAEATFGSFETGDGEPMHVGVVRDVTERRERERALEESERRYRTLAENFPNGAVGVFDEDLRYTLAGGAKLGTDLPSAEELEGERMPDVFPDETTADLEPLFRTAVEDGETHSTTTEFGGRNWRVWAAPLVDADGEIFAGLSFAQDVTEQIERENHLQRYETIVETVNDGVYVVDADGQFTMVNEAYADMLEYETEDLVGTDVTAVVDESTHEQAQRLETEMREETDEQPTLEADMLTASGDRVPAEANFALLPEGDDTYHRVGVARDVSERKERQRQLEESERRYRTLAENFPDGAVGMFDENLEYTAVGGQFLEEAGIDEDDRVGNSVYDIYPDELVAEVEPYFQAALQGEANTFEAEFHDRYLHAHTLPVGDADEEVMAGMLVVQDVTERREAQQELRESEAKFRMISENLDEIVWMATADAREFVYVNPTFETVWGIDRDVLYDEASSFLEAVHEADRERVRHQFEALPEEAFDDEFRIVRPDGEVRWVHVRGERVTDEDGEMVRVVGIGKDVTERVERERELERALGLLERTERIANVGGWEIDVDTQDVFWTDHIFDLLDVPGDEEPPLDEALSMYRDEDQQLIEDAVEDALAEGESFDFEVRIQTESGEERWLRLQGVPETRDGEIVSVRGAVQDVTARVVRERQLEELVEKLEESNERLEQFAYAASHDLQEPLRMVSSYLQLIERRYVDALDEDGQEFLEFAVDGADRMREMIDGLLAYSRVDTRGDPFEPVELEDVVANAREDLGVKIAEHDAEITVEDLPRVEGDPGQLRQLFQNLLDNAIDYSGDEPPRIHVGAERAGDTWQVSVRDEGIGMDPEDAEGIFEVFQTLHTREERGGTGIGLALCERIAERHGGDITVDSAPGEGSTFTVALPIQGDDDV